MATPTPTGPFGGAGNSNNPPPPPLSMAGGPPQQGPSVLQILAMGQERNHAADSMAHHPRIDSLVKLGKEAEATWLQIGEPPLLPFLLTRQPRRAHAQARCCESIRSLCVC